MRLVVLALCAVSSLAAAPPSPDSVRPPDSDSELMNAFQTSEVAEIYIVRPDLRTTVGLRPHSVRHLGCRYFLHRSMPQWAEFQSSMAQASVRIDQAYAYGEMRVGLVFGDRAGTVLEIYSSDLPMPDSRVKGYIQRREVGISASFPQALRGFAEAHRNLATVDQARPYLCAAEVAR